MMNFDNITYSNQDLDHFKQWLNLNTNSITWEGRYHKEFEDFWRNFFIPSLTFARAQERFSYVKSKLTTGPLLSWFEWLNNKFIVFTFLNKDVTINQLSLGLSIDPTILSMKLREYFVECYPHLEEELNEIFQISNVMDSTAEYDYARLVSELNITKSNMIAWDDEILASLEVTLYPEWKKLIHNFDNDMYRVKKLRWYNESFFQYKNFLKFLQELIVFSILGGLLIFSIKTGSQWYEENLASRISLFEPDFFWLDKNLTFKSQASLTESEIELSAKQIDELEQIENTQDPFEGIEELRFDGESDVIVTSLDSLPKNFEILGTERSSFEETRKGGYRDSRYGTGKAYRVMMNSVQAEQLRGELNKLLDTYQAEQVDQVQPGKNIPGGVYYNIYVPLVNLREFLARVTSLENAIIYESKTTTRTPYGKAKIFIWIKSI